MDDWDNLMRDSEFIEPMDFTSATFSFYRSYIVKALLTIHCDNTFTFCTRSGYVLMFAVTLLYCYHTRYFYIGTMDRLFSSLVFSIVRFRVLSFVRNSYLWYVSQSEHTRASMRLQQIKWEFIKEMYPTEFARFREQNLLNQLYQSSEQKEVK